MIEVNERIDVPAPPDAVWALLSDPRAVVDCVPGASLGDAHEDGSLDAVTIIKFGPIKVTFKAKVALELDPASNTGKVTSRGRDNQGGTKFNANMTFGVLGAPGTAGSIIDIKATVEIFGRLASVVE